MLGEEPDYLNNPVLGSWFGLSKAEPTDTFVDVRSTDVMLFIHIKIIYNQQRIQSRPKYVSPAQFALAFHERKKKQKSSAAQFATYQKVSTYFVVFTS